MMTDNFREVAMQSLSYDPETGIFRWKENKRGTARKGDVAGYDRGDGYVKIKVSQSAVWAHRLAWLFYFGEWPKHSIDHINGNPSDNRIENLRDVPAKINSQNRRGSGPRRNGGTLIGAHWCPTWKRWKSSIGIDGKSKHIGWFGTEQEAHAAYIKAKRQLHEGCTI